MDYIILNGLNLSSKKSIDMFKFYKTDYFQGQLNTLAGIQIKIDFFSNSFLHKNVRLKNLSPRIRRSFALFSHQNISNHVGKAIPVSTHTILLFWCKNKQTNNIHTVSPQYNNTINFVPKDIAIKMNLLLKRILNG